MFTRMNLQEGRLAVALCITLTRQKMGNYIISHRLPLDLICT